ncbi:MAG: phosphoribosyl-AMP cyclohydrolase [Acidobacteria bacterium]|nr:phosphoribosyl-AMP cyclohydrolase [Acidobacteriota bacterium]MBI3484424.1 phosphoribosyl-AMP cyclohydrolase [Acidobacteriota bacterium]
MQLDFGKLGGLVPAVVQDFHTGEVLMLGFMNSTALEATLATGNVTFFSRSRHKLWVKGERSGHRLRLRELRIDCDADAVLARVEPLGPGVCHEGFASCFFRRLDANGESAVTAEKTFDPAQTYGEGKRS